MEDARIIELYWQRDESAIRSTEQKYGFYCYQVSYNILSDRQDAEECVSDTWLRAWNVMPPQRPDRLKLFLAKITRNLSLDCLKIRHAQKRGRGELPLILDELAECVADSGNVESEFIAKELTRDVNAFVRSLPEREGNLFIRRYFFCESVGQVARRYGLTEGNAAVILSRTRQKLKCFLQQKGYEI